MSNKVMNERPEFNEIWISDRNGNKIAMLEHLFRSLRMSGLALAKSRSPDEYQLGYCLTTMLENSYPDTNIALLQSLSDIVVDNASDMPSEVYRAQGCTMAEQVTFAIDEARDSHYLTQDAFIKIFETELHAWCEDPKYGAIHEKDELSRISGYKAIFHSIVAFISDPDARTKSSVLCNKGIAMSVREAKINGLFFNGQALTDDYMQDLVSKASCGSLRDKAIFIAAKWNRSMFGCKQVYFKKSDIEGIVKVNLLGTAHIIGDYHVVAEIEGVGDVLIDRLMRI